MDNTFKDKIKSQIEAVKSKTSKKIIKENKNNSKDYKKNLPIKIYDLNLNYEFNINFCAENNFIGISGLIGAGKTLFAQKLANSFNLPVYYEPKIENDFIEAFYKDKNRYYFSLSIHL